MVIILPPFVLRRIVSLFYGWHGNYSSWDKARMKCSGYDSKTIFAKVKEASTKVKDGNAAYERASVTFSTIQFNFPLISALLWIAKENNGTIKVLDYGGALGSSYYQNRFFISSLNQVKWFIVEQTDFVKIGKSDFTDDLIDFYYTIEDCINNNKIDLVILSSVLPYLEKPYELLEKIKKCCIPFVFIDKMPFTNEIDRITIQKVNPSIYRASYPCWFFNRKKFDHFMNKDYSMIYEFENTVSSNIRSEFKGFLFKKK
jgi:putative methyltransferase (TIGR04325 family)